MSALGQKQTCAVQRPMSAKWQKRTSHKLFGLIAGRFRNDLQPPQFILGRLDAKAARGETSLMLRRYLAPSSTYSFNVLNEYQAIRGSTLSLVERTVHTSSTAALSQASVAERPIALPPEHR
jgi:hypothetical protein